MVKDSELERKIQRHIDEAIATGDASKIIKAVSEHNAQYGNGNRVFHYAEYSIAVSFDDVRAACHQLQQMGAQDPLGFVGFVAGLNAELEMALPIIRIGNPSPEAMDAFVSNVVLLNAVEIVLGRASLKLQ